MQYLDYIWLSSPELRILAGVDRRTWRRWLTGTHRIPAVVLGLGRGYSPG